MIHQKNSEFIFLATYVECFLCACLFKVKTEMKWPLFPSKIKGYLSGELWKGRCSLGCSLQTCNRVVSPGL